MDLASIYMEAQKNVEMLSIFFCFCALFEIYFILLLIFLFRDNGWWISLMANRTAVRFLLVALFIGCFFIVYSCFFLDCTSLIGISAVMVITGYLLYLYHFDPLGLVMLPIRIQKWYLSMVIIYVFLALIALFLSMLGQGAIILNIHTAQVFMEEIQRVQPEPGTDNPQISCPLEPAIARGNARGTMIDFLDRHLIKQKVDLLVEAPTKPESIDFQKQLVAAARGAEGAAPAYLPEQLGVNMGDNGMVSRHIVLKTEGCEQVNAIAVCATREHLTQITMDQQDQKILKGVTWLSSKCLLP